MTTRTYNREDAEFCKRMTQLEAKLDEHFCEELALDQVSKLVAREALLDVTEELLTGQGKEIDGESGALASYFNNITNSASATLRAISRFASDEKIQPDDDFDLKIRDCVSVCSHFAVVEDAFYSFWKGYNRARLHGADVWFELAGTELDARLRAFAPTRDALEGSSIRYEEPLLRDPKLMQAFGRSLSRAKFRRQGGFEYWIEMTVIRSVAEEFERVLTPRLLGVLDLSLGEVTSRDVFLGWCRVLAVSQLHQHVRLVTGKGPTQLHTSFVFPALYRKRDFWLRVLADLPHPAVLLEILSFDAKEKVSDICNTPIVPIGPGYFGTVPSSNLHADVPRNFVVLLASRFGPQYSTFSTTREEAALSEYRERVPSLVVGTQVHLPRWNGRQLPDIDLILREPSGNTLVIAELKWQLSAISTREVVSRNEYLKKGHEQLKRIREFLAAKPSYLRERGLLDKETSDLNVVYLLLCKGHLGSEAIIAGDTISMADSDVFLSHLTQGLELALEVVRTFSYLPVIGRDFLVKDVRVRFGASVVTWKMRAPNSTTEDTETDFVEGFYFDGIRFKA
jgi:hypothetical protein